MHQGIEITGISHSFHHHQVLSDIHLAVKKGEIMGLLGPSGAGKTTLVNIITGQLTPDAGTVSINVSSPTRDRPHPPAIGIMMDNWGLYDRLSVYDNLKFYAKIFHAPASRINTVLEKTGLASARKSLAGNLSKGMLSRLKLCRALLKDIEILFLDEPTSGLDPATMQDIHSLILEQKQKGTTIFLTTHNMSEAAALCDHVALLNEGKIVEYGSPAEICKRYNHLNKITVWQKDGHILELPNSRESAERLKLLLEDEGIATIHSSEPDLEKVFLELTGRKLA